LPVNASAPATGSIWYNSGTGQINYKNGSGTQILGAGGTGTVTNIATGTGLTGGPISSSGTISLASFGTAGTYYKVTTDSTGRVSTGSASLAETDLPIVLTPGKVVGDAITSGTIGGSTAMNTTGNIVAGGVSASNVSGNAVNVYKPGNGFSVGITAPSSLAANYSLVLPPTQASAGQVLSNDGSGNLSWVTSGGGGVASVGASGPITSTGGSTPTIGINQASSSSNGYLSQTDWNTFNGKMGSALTSGQIFVGNASNVATGVAASGDVSLTNTGAFTVHGLGGVATSIASLSADQFLKYNGTNWVNASLAVSDISGLSTTLASTINASQMPGSCAANQTLTFSSPTGTWNCSTIAVTGSAFGSQSQAAFLAGPTSGSGTPTFRGIASTDLPTSGTTGVFVNNGNSFGQPARIGTSDSNTLALQTNGVTAVTVSTAQNVGIGITSPSAALNLRAGVTSAGGAPLKLSAGTNLTSPEAGAIEFDGTSLFYTDSGLARHTLGVAGSGFTAMTGDVSATGAGSVTSTVNAVGGVTAANVALGANAANAATNINTASTIVRRDAGGNFLTNSVTFNQGTGAAPSINFATDTTTGLYDTGTQGIGFASGGVGIATLNPGNFLIGVTTTVNGYSGTAYTPTSGSVAVPNGGEIISAYNTAAQDGEPALVALRAVNSTSYAQNAYMGAISTSGSVYTPSFVFGRQTGASSYAESMRISSSGNVGIGTTTPNALLDIGSNGSALGTLRLEGGTSGYVQIQPATAAGSWTMTLPNNSGTSGQVLTTNGTGTLSWATAVTPGGSNAFAVGTASAPGVSFTGDTTSGLYDLVPGVGVSVSGSQIASFTSTGETLASNGSLNFGSGTGSFNMSSSTGNFSTSTGSVALNGATTLAAGKNLTMASGAGQFAQTYSGIGPAHSITDTAAASGDVVDITSTSTAAVSGDKGLSVAISGANGTSSVTRYGEYSNVTATGTSSTNVAGYFSASGGTNNYGIVVPNGQVGIGTTAPTSLLTTSETRTDISGTIISNGTFQTLNPASSGANFTALEGNSSTTASSTSVAVSTGVLGTVVHNSTSAVLTTATGSSGTVQNTSTGSINNAFGSKGTVTNTSGGAISTAFGSQFAVTNSSTGTVSTAYGSYDSIANNSTGSITTAYGNYIAAPTNAGGTIGTYYGLYVGAPGTAATVGYAAVFAGGNVGIGTTTPTALLTVNGDAQINGLFVGRANAGAQSTGVGQSVFASGTGGNYNAAFGNGALGSGGATSANTAVGAFAGGSTTGTGSNNTFLGYEAGMNNMTGSQNTLVGYSAGTNLATGSDNIAIGYNAGVNATGGSGNNIFIGTQAGPPSQGTVNNTLYIGNGSTPIIFGNLTSGNVGIGTTAPAAALQVQGSIVSSENLVPSGATANFASGNAQTLESVGGSTITLSGMVAGGDYQVLITDTTSRTYTFSGCANKFVPANSVTTSGYATIYRIHYSSFGSGTCYINWTTGYQ
jgi:hypothetical protein